MRRVTFRLTFASCACVQQQRLTFAVVAERGEGCVRRRVDAAEALDDVRVLRRGGADDLPAGILLARAPLVETNDSQQLRAEVLRNARRRDTFEVDRVSFDFAQPMLNEK